MVTGHVYGSVENLSLLSTLDNATIQASVLASLSVGISSLAGTDSSIDINEFGVVLWGSVDYYEFTRKFSFC